MTLEVIRTRASLGRTQTAIATGKVTIGFLGGSITDPRVGYNWPEPVVAHLVRKYPGVRVSVENAAIGATGSDSAVFRANRDIVDRECDLVFVEYAVNDSGTEAVIRGRSREGLLRKLLGAGMDVVIVYTFSPDMHADMAAGIVPQTIADFERLADHYDVPSVWMGLHALNEVNAGLLRWYEWLPDNLHPQYRGSQLYSDAVNSYLDRALDESPQGSNQVARTLAQPLDALHWENAQSIHFDDVLLSGPWSIRRWCSYEWISQSLETSAVGARVSIPFSGSVLWLGIDFGKRSADFRCRIDDGDWVEHRLERAAWVGDSGWFRGILLGYDLAPVHHTATIETVYRAGEQSLGTDFKIGLIGVVPAG